ncbi:MAG TPA: transcription-repair coupling factor [Dehalococcoidia bacterium]|nr:transcription-repair coupling factor [Dehalococcoidia bacterium]
MNLSGLLALVEDMPSYRKLIRGLQEVKGENRAVVLDSAKPYLLACLYRYLGFPMLVITDRSERARQLYDEIPIWLGNGAQVRLFPEHDSLPYERLSSDSYTVQQRLKLLADLSEGDGNLFIITSAHAIIRKIVSAATFASSCHILRKGMQIDLEQTLSRWTKLGYEMESTVDIPGTMSRRGGILDIYPPNSEFPVRIELFGDAVDSLRFFDPASQRSIELVNQVTVIPAKEVVVSNTELDDVFPQLDLSTMKPEARGRVGEDMARLASAQWFDGLDFYASLFNDGVFLDHLSQHTLIVLDQPDSIEAAVDDLAAQATELCGMQVERGELPYNFPVPYFTWSEIAGKLERFERRLALEPWERESQHHVVGFGTVTGYGGRVDIFLKDNRKILKDKRRVIIVSQQAARLSELLEEQDIIAAPVTDIVSMPPPGSITLVQGSLAAGWTADSEDTVFSDMEIFGFAKTRRMVPKHPVRRDTFFSELSQGDYVVHIDHGIARFSGLTRLSLDNGEREYLVLDYAAGDRLYVPSEQVDRVGRYIGPGGYTPSLSRLGTQEWSRAKQRVREAAGNLARELLAIYSAREVLDGFAFSPDSPWQQELEASFPYVETLDQMKAVQEVKKDMESKRPMDRLVCGDVGYGKTEVAIRAAFKAVMDGMQVAVLVPTTVLAQQHLTTFSERLGAFPVRIELLSRFRSQREQQEVLQGLANGSVDICIGTHRLVQKDVSFKNLGLIITDEEQRFGVAHKERLKQLRREVDVLTLSATPIPRTLHMSLVGIRDMSTMETPPEERFPIKTYVSFYDERLVREAVLRELERNGQVFYVHNRVQRIGWVARKLEELIPEARIGVAHGQMPEEALESVMLDFTRGRLDLLLCSTIIESGLDLPNVNTLIVDDADRMGLTQLYQLRGRVGRGANRAYAYFFYKKGKQLTDAAQKRLRTIFEATELGAGFRIAMRDLEIRGAGNLLGHEQSGHMGAVGFELYCRLLADAVDELKAGGKQEAIPEPFPTTVDLPLPVYIPEDYVSDLSTRLALYMRLAGVGSLEQVDEMTREFEDRFGSLPSQLEDLLYIVRIKIMGCRVGVQDIHLEKGQVVVKLGPGTEIDKDYLQDLFGDKLRIGPTQLRLDVRRVGKGWRKVLEQLLERIAYSTGGS